MNEWQIIHRYRRLVSEDKAQPLMCPQCNHEFTLMIGLDERPVLWCAWEDELYKTGLQFWADIRAVVSEYYLEN